MTDLHPGSFRDPAGFVYRRDGTLYRQVNRAFGAEFDAFLGSGLYDELRDAGILIAHRPADPSLAATPDAHRVLEPDVVPFVSYPYEWCFSALKDAALLTLDAQRRALRRGMTMRDASAYNVQFVDGRPVVIDTLSFAPRADGQPWAAYRQFCEHFLGPLALMARRHAQLGVLHRDFADGVPLELTSALLDAGSRLRVGLLLHVHLHARAQRRYAGRAAEAAALTMPTRAVARLVDHLDDTVRALAWRAPRTAWAAYERDHGYSEEARASKVAIVTEWLGRVRPATVWDLGANTGAFSRVAADAGARVVAMDSDHTAVEACYLNARARADTRLLPLVVDLRAPSPASGWAGRERAALAERGPADLALALALVHHLTLGAQVPLASVAAWLRELAPSLIVEFVPPDDPQVARLLAGRREAPHEYGLEAFERAFDAHWGVRAAAPIADSGRRLYLMAARGHERAG